MDAQKAWIISVSSALLIYLFFFPTSIFLWAEKTSLLFFS